MSDNATIKIATWNLEWAVPTSRRGKTISGILTAMDADILCLTEAHPANFPSGYHIVSSRDDYGYPLKPDRRKVLIGSKTPWIWHDDVGHSSLPSGRFVQGKTQNAAGEFQVMGICIPWADAHVRSGRRDRERWQDHEAYLEGLISVNGEGGNCPVIVAGDFNQRLPRKRQPKQIYQKLERAFEGLSIVTRGFEFEGRQTIDHIAVSPGLSAGPQRAIPDQIDGLKLSDHFGIIVELAKIS